MQVMQLAKHLLLLATALTVTGAGRAAAQGQFDSVPANASCTARTVSAAARGEIECAMLSSNSSSFSFINGVCTLSDSPDCAVSGAGSVFRRRISTTPPSQKPGYVQQIGDRQFWVFQHRQTGQVDFNRTWVEYEQGFGNGLEFWIGLRQLNNFTKSHNNTLRIEATTVEGKFYFGEWLNFTVGDASTSYIMNCGAMIGGSSNFTGDAMSTSRGKKFSTKDVDNDEWSSNSCSLGLGSSGFWYGNCMDINPNGWFSSTQGDGFMGCRYAEDLKALSFIRMMLQI